MIYNHRRAASTHAAVKRHYLATGHTEADWQIVNQNPQLFNRAWRKMLGWPRVDTPPIIKN